MNPSTNDKKISQLRPKVLVIGALSSSLVNFRAPLLEELLARGAEVHAAASHLLADEETCSKLHDMGIVPHDIPFERAGMNPFRDLAALFVARRLMLQLKPDVVLGYTIKPVIFGMLAGRLARVPQCIAMITGLGFAFSDGGINTKRILANRLARGLYKLSLSNTNTVLFQNPDDRALFSAQKLLPIQAKIGVINGSGVDMSYFQATPLPNAPIKFLLVARLLADKGIREYVQAAKLIKKEYPDVEFHLAGGVDPNPSAIPLKEVQAWVQDGVITWYGHINDVRPIMANCHIYILPSYREGTPRTVLEAMAMRRPVITTDVPGCRETTKDGINGFLVEVRSADAIAEAIRRFLSKPELIDQMAGESLSIVRSKYEKTIVAKSVVDEIDLLVDLDKSAYENIGS